MNQRVSRHRPISSVHVDLARLGYEFYRISAESALSTDSADSKESPDRLTRARAKWISELVECLMLRDPSRSSYGAHLLAEVDEYRKAEIQRKRQERDSKESALSEDSLESVDSQPRADRADRSGKKNGSRPGKGSRSKGGSRDSDGGQS